MNTAKHHAWLLAGKALLSDCLNCCLCRQPFIEVAEQQLAATVDQLLLAYGVSDAATWGRIITCLAEEAVGKLSPALAVAHGNLDPRFYIKVSRIHVLPGSA